AHWESEPVRAIPTPARSAQRGSTARPHWLEPAAAGTFAPVLPSVEWPGNAPGDYAPDHLVHAARLHVRRAGEDTPHARCERRQGYQDRHHLPRPDWQSQMYLTLPRGWRPRGSWLPQFQLRNFVRVPLVQRKLMQQRRE